MKYFKWNLVLRVCLDKLQKCVKKTLFQAWNHDSVNWLARIAMTIFIDFRRQNIKALKPYNEHINNTLQCVSLLKLIDWFIVWFIVYIYIWLFFALLINGLYIHLNCFNQIWFKWIQIPIKPKIEFSLMWISISA